jgi:plastocyanin
LRAAFGLLVIAGAMGACEEVPDPRYQPDAMLQRELGLTPADRVHTVTVTGGPAEAADPEVTEIAAGVWVQFVSGDWFVHELAFEMDSLGTSARVFLMDTDQIESPPLLQRDARFVVSFEGAPPGRYPYLLQGNGRAGRGVIVVADSVGG